MVFRKKICVWLFLCFIVGAIPARAIDDPSGLAIWRRSSSLLDNLDVKYDFNVTPTDQFIKEASNTPVPREHSSDVEDMLSQTRGSMRVEWRQPEERYEIDEERRRPIFSPNGITFTSWTVALQRTQIHGKNQFFVYDATDHTGAVRPSWPIEVPNIISDVIFPLRDEFEIKPLENPNTFELKSKTQQLAMRVYLNPDSGMMPLKIEYYKATSTGSPFFYRAIIVNKYGEYNGAFVPTDATVHDLCYRAADGSESWQIEKHIRLTSAAVGIKIDDSRFSFTFPRGTFVNDLIAGITYKVTEGGNNEFQNPEHGAHGVMSELASIPPASNGNGFQIRTVEIAVWLGVAALAIVIALIVFAQSAIARAFNRLRDVQ